MRSHAIDGWFETSMCNSRTAPHLWIGPLSSPYSESALPKLFPALCTRLHLPDCLCRAWVELFQLLLEWLPRPCLPTPHADDPSPQRCNLLRTVFFSGDRGTHTMHPAHYSKSFAARVHILFPGLQRFHTSLPNAQHCRMPLFIPIINLQARASKQPAAPVGSAVQLKHIRGACLCVQAVHILCDQRINPAGCLQARERLVRCVWLHTAELVPACKAARPVPPPCRLRLHELGAHARQKCQGPRPHPEHMWQG